jgi:hypothetical protein
VVDPFFNIFTKSDEFESFEEQTRKEIEERVIEAYKRGELKESPTFTLADPLITAKEGVEAIVKVLLFLSNPKDSFTACFEQRPPEPWNFNVFLFILWVIGVAVRYFILLPIR